MELRSFNYLVSVAEECDVDRAAAELSLSHPAVSRRNADLEDELRGLLLQRDGSYAA